MSDNIKFALLQYSINETSPYVQNKKSKIMYLVNQGYIRDRPFPSFQALVSLRSSISGESRLLSTILFFGRK